MDDQALAAELDERQRGQARERRLRRLAGHQRLQQRERDAPQHRRGVERLAGRRVEPVEVQPGELLHDRRQDRVLRRVRARLQRGGGELERQRMPAGEAVDPGRLLLVEPRAAQHLVRVRRRERAERHGAQQRAERGPPGGARRVAGGEHDAHMRGQRGQQLAAQPAVDQAQPLRGVDDEHRGRRARGREEAAGRRAAVGKIPACGGVQRGLEAGRRRLDRATVDSDHGRAARGRLPAERPQQRGLAGPGDAVHDRRERAVVLEHAQQRGQLRLAPDEGGAALREERSQRARHGQGAAIGSGSGAATSVATTGLTASVGSISASAWRCSTSGSLAS